MPLPDVEPLFAHLCVLRDAADPCAPEHQARWRAVARWLESAFSGASTQEQEARQATLISLLRHVREMRAESPLQAAKWVAVIHRRKRVDLARRRTHDPVHAALRGDRQGDDRPSLVERVAAEDEPAADPALVDAILERVSLHVRLALEESEPSATKRLLRATQAQAALLRLVREADVEAIAAALDYGEPLGKDRIYKWVERGRPVVLLGLEHWERSIDEEEREEVGLVIATLRELMEERRADAGVPRPDRRRPGNDDGART